VLTEVGMSNEEIDAVFRDSERNQP
jgi:hypothetical protein